MNNISKYIWISSTAARSNLAYLGEVFSRTVFLFVILYIQIFAMILNNLVWVAFWALFFTRFPILRGWNIKDVITLWAMASAGFGIAHAICGNALQLTSLIVRGQLDVWMLYPRALLPHLLLGQMNATSWGDMLFGYGVYIFFVKPDALYFGSIQFWQKHPNTRHREINTLTLNMIKYSTNYKYYKIRTILIQYLLK